MMKNRTNMLYKDASEFEVKETYTGKQLEGKRYEPIFHYFDAEGAKGWRVLCDNFVTDESGTGIVHCAPAFGEDDYRVCIANGVIDKGENIVCPVDASGRFTAQVKEWAGVHVKVRKRI
jgi:isoleucyl-tRNA synthetase